jgi:hypothetical protein
MWNDRECSTPLTYVEQVTHGNLIVDGCDSGVEAIFYVDSCSRIVSDGISMCRRPFDQ